MTEFPKGVRLAQQGDERRLFDLCCIAHGENGFGTLDLNAPRIAIDRAIRRDELVFAVIDGPDRIEATLGLRMSKPWYCSNDSANWYWDDLLFFVHPLHRRSRHAMKLIKFAEWWSDKTQMPVAIMVLPRDGDIERRDKLFRRHASRAGSTFIIGRPLFNPQSSTLIISDIDKCAA